MERCDAKINAFLSTAVSDKEQETTPSMALQSGLLWFLLCTAMVLGLMAAGSDCGGIVYCYGDSRDYWWHPTKVIGSLAFALLLPLPHILVSLFFRPKRNLAAILHIAKSWHKIVGLLLAGLIGFGFLSAQLGKSSDRQLDAGAAGERVEQKGDHDGRGIDPVVSPSREATPAESSAERKWKKDTAEKGLFCIPSYDFDKPTERAPAINSDGVFFCPCSTDMDCVVANPHLPEDLVNSGHRLNTSKWPKGTACDNPISWDNAGQYVGKTFIVVGPVVRITKPKGVRGNPVWIDIGATFPDTRRLTLVLWENQKSNFPEVTQDLMGKNICVLGKIDIYKGASQIELKKPVASFW